MTIVSRLQWRTAASWIGLFALTALFSISPSPVAAASQARIDRAIVFRVGDIRLSRYLLDKYYGRFAATRKQDTGETSVLPEIKAWFGLFLSQLVLVAHARQQGYRNRAEIDDIVARMSRYVLTKPDGPYYARLYSAIPSPSELRTRSLYLQSGIARDALIVRIDGTLDERDILGDNFATQSPEEKIRCLSSLTTGSGVMVYNGPITWPYRPFSEIADQLLNLTRGILLEQHRQPIGTFFAYVRSDNVQQLPAFNTVRASFLQSVNLVDQEQFLEGRKNRVLEAAEFRLEGPAAWRLSDFVRNLPAGTSEIPDKDFGAFWKAELFSYKVEGRTESVSVGLFCAHFNKLFVRQMPATVIILRQCTLDMAMEELDFRKALKAGVDCDPKFVEDRYGFDLMQILGLFEKEVILPNLEVAAADIQEYYDNHSSDFQRTTAVRGYLVRFRDADMTRPQSEKAVDITDALPLPGFENFQRMILNGPPGQLVGPVRSNGDSIFFVKERDIAKVSIPIADAVSAIRTALLRQQMNSREVVMASQIYKMFRIEDNIDYRQYGLASGCASVPWKR